MVKSAPMRDHSIVIKPRRRAGRSVAMLMLILILSCIVMLGMGFFVPARLALVQERMVGVFHGGVASSVERTFVDACVRGDEGPQAVTRTVRTTIFQDGTSISVTFSSAPTPTNSQCAP